MEHTALMAFALIGFDNPESRSALPNAPIVDDSRTQRVRSRRSRRLRKVRGGLANALHRLAWSLEPGLR